MNEVTDVINWWTSQAAAGKPETVIDDDTLAQDLEGAVGAAPSAGSVAS
jgi:hypothetical protein